MESFNVRLPSSTANALVTVYEEEISLLLDQLTVPENMEPGRTVMIPNYGFYKVQEAKVDLAQKGVLFRLVKPGAFVTSKLKKTERYDTDDLPLPELNP